MAKVLAQSGVYLNRARSTAETTWVKTKTARFADQIARRSAPSLAASREKGEGRGMEQLAAFQADIAEAPLWVRYWLNYMGVVLTLAVPFAFVRVEARWAVLVVALTLPAMVALHSVVGYVRLLGIVHVVLWTPFVIYLWRRREHWRVRETFSGKWIALLFATVIISLAFDYADVARWLLGERG